MMTIKLFVIKIIVNKKERENYDSMRWKKK